ncbi:MAG: hypothetical protein CVV25_13185 [Ignavibacteriae bacterium HGW-Ignavibacteriae-4]|nr:MAG: hypothetical protein CVV25_13185 [Ignavibacteriae bacterium HGW-Ignavibacteriae-4]
MNKTINTPHDFVRYSSLTKYQYQINGNVLKFHPFGHTKGSFEAVISFRTNGAIGNYFGGKYRNLFDAIESIGIKSKLVRWVNDK